MNDHVEVVAPYAFDRLLTSPLMLLCQLYSFPVEVR
jgi:hypothetical protein